MGRVVLAVVGACVVLAVAFYFLAYQPLNEQRTALEQETASLDTQASQLRNQLATLQAIREDELTIQADLNRLRALIPAGEPAQPSFVRQVQVAADSAGVEIQSLVFGTPAAVEGAPPAGAEGLVLAEIPLTAIVEGGYFQAVDLFRRLEVDVTRGVIVDTVGILEAEDGFPTLSVAVTGRIFALLPVVEVAPPPAEPSATAPTPGATEGASPAPTEAAS